MQIEFEAQGTTLVLTAESDAERLALDIFRSGAEDVVVGARSRYPLGRVGANAIAIARRAKPKALDLSAFPPREVAEVRLVEFEYRDLTATEEEWLLSTCEDGRVPLPGYRRCARREKGTEQWYVHFIRPSDQTTG